LAKKLNVAGTLSKPFNAAELQAMLAVPVRD